MSWACGQFLTRRGHRDAPRRPCGRGGHPVQREPAPALNRPGPVRLEARDGDRTGLGSVDGEEVAVVGDEVAVG
jgi:hypothetical protein